MAKKTTKSKNPTLPPGVYYEGKLIDIISEQSNRYIARVNGSVQFIPKRLTTVVK